MINFSEIQAVSQKIGRRFPVKQIYLFGSYAYGTPSKDSDVDLLVCMDTPLRNIEQAAKIRNEIDFPFPVDLLVRTPEQLEERKKVGDKFFMEITAKGKVIYETLH